jgi:hypothetical protein
MSDQPQRMSQRNAAVPNRAKAYSMFYLICFRLQVVMFCLPLVPNVVVDNLPSRAKAAGLLRPAGPQKTTLGEADYECMFVFSYVYSTDTILSSR